ncbi:hypothetical protein KAR91_51895 [Candidatus Pacearchaeota archaeon]|nr:hypothetical protein [Candidatus Pacearchaeota archaeon]
MAHKYVCDGCEAMTDDSDEFTTKGHALKRQYCPDCLSKVEDYMGKLDDLHTKTAKAFQSKLGGLQKTFSKDGFNLPDVASDSK